VGAGRDGIGPGGREGAAGEPAGTGPDEAFLAGTAARLAGLPGVRAVALGGSRATGAHRPDSDWDLAVYYGGTGGARGFSPAAVRALGWPGEVSEIGGWGGGVFNGGAWLEVEGRRVDVHYRDLAEVERWTRAARAGRFEVERLLFHLAGVPTYILMAELAVNRVLHGALPRPRYPAALRRSAPERWWGEARATLGYVRAAHAARGRLADCAGGVATAACQAAHAVLAARGIWVTNEKELLTRAGLRGVDEVLAGLSAAPAALTTAVDQAAELLGRAVAEATGGAR